MSTTPAAASGALDPTLAAALNQELSRHARILHSIKSGMAALVPEGLDAAAFGLLLTLVGCGPRRQGELAELCLLDPSTVSRHVAQLARAGYVQRRPDPHDGRAVQLVATDEGTALAREIGRRRQSMIAKALSRWAPEDLEHLVALLARLNDDLDAFRPHFVRALVDPALPDAPADPAAAPGPHHNDFPDQRHHDQESS
jgi:DNA-binding MarR family transcriptional regulator